MRQGERGARSTGLGGPRREQCVEGARAGADQGCVLGHLGRANGGLEPDRVGDGGGHRLDDLGMPSPPSAEHDQIRVEEVAVSPHDLGDGPGEGAGLADTPVEVLDDGLDVDGRATIAEVAEGLDALCAEPA